ncbi:MAG: T9SS type A sorting domain-containing protein [Flavobacteriales bacterium]
MKLILTTAFITLLVHTQFAQTLIGPESVEMDPADGSYFISNTATADILKLSPGGALTVFTSTAMATYGLELVGDTLYACMSGTLVGFHRVTGAQVVNANLGGSFLNGITHDNTNLYLTDFNTDKIIRYNYHTGQFNDFVIGLVQSPNGIIYDDIDNRLVFVSWGSNAPIKAINLADSSVVPLITTTIGNLDGIAMNCQGEFMVSSWSPSSRVSKFNHTFSAQGVNMGFTGLSSPADIYFDKLSDTLCIPNTGNDIVKKEHVTSCVSSVQQLEEKTEITLWPNPSEGKFAIANLPAGAYIRLFDVSGKEPRIPVRIIRDGNDARLDITAFPSGMYFLHVVSEGRKQVLRIVRN